MWFVYGIFYCSSVYGISVWDFFETALKYIDTYDNNLKSNLNIETESSSSAIVNNSVQPLTPKSKARLSFNNTDAVLDMGTNKVAKIDAPKDVSSLEQIAQIRHEQRKLEEEEYDEETEETQEDGLSLLTINQDCILIDH